MLDCTRASGLTFLYPERDSVVGPVLRTHGEFARPEVDFLVDAAEGPAGTMLDLGANIGAIALPFATRRPGWRVRAVEAHRDLAGVLAANTFGNHIYNVEVINAAAGARREIVEFPTHPLSAHGNFGDSGFHQTGARLQPVLMLPVDEIALPDTSVIKVDVQGYEPEVLRGAARVLAARQAIWFLEAPTASVTFREMVEILLQADYALYWFWSPFGTATSPRQKATDLVGDANVVAVPPGRRSPWELPVLKSPDETRPGSSDAYPYLKRYGS